MAVKSSRRNVNTTNQLVVVLAFTVLPVAVFIGLAGFITSSTTIYNLCAILFGGLISCAGFFKACKERRANKILASRKYQDYSAWSKITFKSMLNYSAVIPEYQQAQAKQMLKINLIDHGENWLLCDLDLSEIVYSRNNAKLGHYTVIEAKLKQSVPRLMLDSKKARGWQFKRFYAGAQKLTLDAAAERIFAAYSPLGHEIETLSFVTPEVVVAALNMADCDIEFIGNSLLIYYPRLLETEKLADFKRRSVDFLAAVNDNLTPQRRRPRKIEAWGHYLLGDTKIYKWLLGASIFVFVASGLASQLLGDGAGSLLITGLLGLGVAITISVAWFNTVRHNRPLEALMQQS